MPTQTDKIPTITPSVAELGKLTYTPTSYMRTNDRYDTIRLGEIGG